MHGDPWLTRMRTLVATHPEEARRRLLDAAVSDRIDDGALRAYCELFPPSAALRRKLDGPFADLRSGASTARLSAARGLARELMKVASKGTEAWASDPRATGALIEALDERDPKILELVVVATARAAEQYLRDRRALAPLRAQLDSPRWVTRLWAVKAVWSLAGWEALDDLMPRLSDRATAVRLEMVSGVGRAALDVSCPAVLKPGLQSALWEALHDADAGVRSAAAGGFLAVGDATWGTRLREAHRDEVDALVKDALAVTIARLE